VGLFRAEAVRSGDRLGRRAIAVGASSPFNQANVAAALALTGHEAEAREALQQFLALPSGAQFGTIAAFKARNARFANVSLDPRVPDTYARLYEGLRKAGLPEGEAKTH
jgi:hypothetical protein